MRYKYALPLTTRTKDNYSGPGRFSDPNEWVTGPDPVRREKYYGFLKHRSQAWHRKQEYDLQWNEWEQLWPDHDWELRGRKIDDLIIFRLDPELPWCKDNVCVDTRRKHFEHCVKRRRDVKQ